MHSLRFLRVVVVALLLLPFPAAAEHPAALKPYADKFEADYTALQSAKELQLKPARERYLASLTAAQRVATATAKTADIAAIASEMEGVNSDSLTPDAPPDLPRTLTADRRSYTAISANIARTVPLRQRELAGKYLQTLAALDANALRARDQALCTAIAAEKQRVLGLMEAVGGGQRNRNVIANGDFSQGEPGKWPPGWKQSADDVSVTDATIVTEGTEKFIRFRRLQAVKRSNLTPDRPLLIPARTKWAEFSFRMRVKGYVVGSDWDIHPGIKFTACDARGEGVATSWGQAKQDSGWKRYTGRVEIPATAKTLSVTMGPHASAGIVDFDDLVVEFR